MSSEEPSPGASPGLAAMVGRMLTSRRLPLVAAALAVFFALPALGNGWMLDDYYHRSVLLGTSRLRPLLGPPSEMFRFFRGDSARTGRVMDVGLFPWWTDPDIKGEFLQALTVLTHRLDYALWTNSPMLMHAQSLLWLGAAVFVAAIFYRRILGPAWIAGAAALLFAVDDARGATAGFLANRNVLIAATFGVSCLIAHDRWRKDGSRPSALLAVSLLLAALFSKEEGIGTCAYLASYALFIDPRGGRGGVLALWPYFGAVVVWAVLRGSMGYGVHDMGLYVDPLTDARRFAAAAAFRFPILLLGLWTPIWADFGAGFQGPMLVRLWWVAMAFLALLASVTSPLLRGDRNARFWAVGMLFATIPVCATAPMDRLLTFAGVGASGLLAQYLAFVFGKEGAPSNSPWRVPARGLAWFFVVVHIVLAPFALPLRAANPVGPRWVDAKFYIQIPLGPSLGDRDVVVVNAPSAANATYLILRREASGLLGPRHMRVLAPAIPSVTIRRLDARTLGIRPHGGYIRWPLDRVFRSERRPFAIGEQVRMTGMTVTITELTTDGRPADATFRFDVPLESPSLVWLCFRGDGFEPFKPPPVDQEVEISIDWKALLSTTQRPGRLIDEDLDDVAPDP